METKEKYIPPQLEIIKFQVSDIITTSGVDDDDPIWDSSDETPND